MLEMFGLLMLLAVFWLVGSLIGAVFKLVFGLVGGLFALLGGLIGVLIGGAVLLLVVPVLALAALPFAAPLLLLTVVVWLIVRANRRPTPAAPPH